MIYRTSYFQWLRTTPTRFQGHAILWCWISQKRYKIQTYFQCFIVTNRDIHTPNSTASFRITQNSLFHARMCFLGVLNDVPLNFRVKPPKIETLEAWSGLSSLNDKKNQILITWKLLSQSWQNFYRGYAPWIRLRGWAYGFPSESKMPDGGHLEFRKC